MSNTVVRKKHILLKIFAILMAVILLLVIAVVVFLKMTFLKSFPELNGEPEVGVWYRITPENAKSSDGSEWHGIFRKGSENKVVV